MKRKSIISSTFQSKSREMSLREQAKMKAEYNNTCSFVKPWRISIIIINFVNLFIWEILSGFMLQDMKIRKCRVIFNAWPFIDLLFPISQIAIFRHFPNSVFTKNSKHSFSHSQRISNKGELGQVSFYRRILSKCLCFNDLPRK